jgi:3-oxoacyl-[acyl-carrier-protein] synthase II
MDIARPLGRTDGEVVVTGMGAVSPFGVGVGPLWEAVRQGHSAIDWMERHADSDPSIYPVRYAAEVKGLRVDDHLKRHCEVRLEKSVQMGMIAAAQALRQARLIDATDRVVDPTLEIATVAGTGHGPCYESEVGHAAFFQRGPATVRPTTATKCMFNSLSSNLSIYFGLTGPNHVIASACSSATAAIGLGALLVRHGYADMVLCGGADAPLAPAVFASWTQLRVLAKHAEPGRACRPFDRERNGLVLGEGAGMVVLESRASAERRGVSSLTRLLGYGSSSDAHHVTTPLMRGQVKAMQNCLSDAGIQAGQVDYLNLHGTGTKWNDATEAQAVVEVFGRRGTSMPASSTKSMLGHSLGASGAIEFLICVASLANHFVPPTINCDDPDPAVGLDYVPTQGRAHDVRIAMSNSFGFGGTNTSLILGKDE